MLRAQRFPLADSSSAFAWDAGSHKEQPSPTQKKGLLSPLISVAVIETLGPIEEKNPSRLEVPLSFLSSLRSAMMLGGWIQLTR